MAKVGGAGRTGVPGGAGRTGVPGGAAPAGRGGAPGTPHEPSAPELWLRNIRMSGFTIVILGLVVLTVAVLAPSLRILIEQRQQIAALQTGLHSEQGTVDALTKNVARWNDPAYVEAQARERLYYVYPGEYSYLVIDDRGAKTTTDGAPIRSTLQTTKVDWVKSLLSSIYTAGLTDAAPDKLVAPTIGG